MTRHPFTRAAKLLWDTLPAAGQERVLNNAWCGHCRSSRRILDFTGVAENGDIRLHGFCAECGHVVVRIIETSESPSRP